MKLEALIAGQDPDALAIIVTDRAGDRRLTYGQLLDGAHRWARRFSELGLSVGDAIALWLPNGAAWLMAELAAARLGLVVTPVNTRFRAPEVREILTRSNARLVIAPRNFAGIDFADLLNQALAAPLPCGAPTSTLLPRLSWAMFIDDGELPEAPGDLPEPVIADQLLNLFTTTGSTGSPKLAMHRQSDLVIRFSAAAQQFGVMPGDRLMCVLPLCGVWGLGIALAALMSGATAVLSPAFDADEAADIMARHRISHLHGGDNMILAILDSPRLSPPALDAWKTCCFGAFTGQPASQTIQRIEAAGANVRATQAYGSSEGLAFITSAPLDAPLEERALAGGALVDSETRLRVVEAGSTQSLPVGDTGEIQLSGPTVAHGYMGDDAATAAAFTADGWYRTGDLGRATADGAVFIARLGDTLRLRGNLVDPSEIENVLCRHADVLEAHVVGAKTPEKGDVAVAFVATKAGHEVSENALREWCRAHLAAFKAPERIIITTDIPKAMGVNGAKVQKGVLRERAQTYFSTPPMA
jgi:fatty-acyl-CoA synthase